MKNSSKVDIQNAIKSIEDNEFSRKELKLILIDLRESLNNESVIKEIAHFVAHKKRNQGCTFIHLENFLSHFIETAQEGGTLNISPVYNKEYVIKELLQSLDLLGFIFNKNLIKKRTGKIIQCLSEIMEDTRLDIKNEFLIEAKIEHPIISGTK